MIQPRPAPITKLVLPAALAQEIAQLSYAPTEQCGLLVGRIDGACGRVAQCVASENLAPQPHREFEIDVALRLRTQRTVRNHGQAVFGLYHTHPSGLARPSGTDHNRAKDEPGMIWLIAASGQICAFRAEADGLVEIALSTGGVEE